MGIAMGILDQSKTTSLLSHLEPVSLTMLLSSLRTSLASQQPHRLQ